MGRVEKTVTFNVCERCQHEWYPRGAATPTVCPKCKSPYWDKPRRHKSPEPPPRGRHVRDPSRGTN